MFKIVLGKFFFAFFSEFFFYFLKFFGFWWGSGSQDCFQDFYTWKTILIYVPALQCCIVVVQNPVLVFLGEKSCPEKIAIYIKYLY